MIHPKFLGRNFPTLKLANDFINLKAHNIHLIYPFEISDYVDAMVAVLQGLFTKTLAVEDEKVVETLVQIVLDRCEEVHIEYKNTMEAWLKSNQLVRCKLPCGIPEANKAELGRIIYSVFFNKLDLKEVRYELER